MSRGFSKAAALLALGLGASAFVPTKLNYAPHASVSPSGGVSKLEGCDAVLKRMEGKVCLKFFYVLFYYLTYCEDGQND